MAPKESSKERGGKGKDNSLVCEYRQRIEPIGSESFRPHEISRRIMPECISTWFEPGWTTIQTCHPTAREVWFKKFRTLFTWDSSLDTKVKQCFNNKCAKILRDRWEYARNSAKNKAPMCATPEGARLAMERWETDENWKKLQARNKENSKGKKSQRGHSRHRTSSKPAHPSIELKREPATYDMYKRYKLMNNDKYLDPNGDKVVEPLEELERRRIKAGKQYSVAENKETNVQELRIKRDQNISRLIEAAETLVEGIEFRASKKSSTPSISCVRPSIADQRLISEIDSLKKEMEEQKQETRRTLELMVDKMRHDREVMNDRLQRITELLMRSLSSRPDPSSSPPPAE